MSGIFGGGGGGSTPAPRMESTARTGLTAAERERSRRIGRAALIKSDQENILSATTGRNVLTAV